MDKTKNKWKIFYKEITKKETRKYSTSTYLKALSNRTVKKSGGGVGRRRKNVLYIFEAKEGKQYQNNGTEYLFVIIIYSIETVKMRLLSIAESFESPKKKQFDFQMTGKIFKRWINVWYVNEEGPSSIFKIEVAHEKMFIVFNL